MKKNKQRNNRMHYFLGRMHVFSCLDYHYLGANCLITRALSFIKLYEIILVKDREGDLYFLQKEKGQRNI